VCSVLNFHSLTSKLFWAFPNLKTVLGWVNAVAVPVVTEYLDLLKEGRLREKDVINTLYTHNPIVTLA
jgi:hypothetical protein